MGARKKFDLPPGVAIWRIHEFRWQTHFGKRWQGPSQKDKFFTSYRLAWEHVTGVAEQHKATGNAPVTAEQLVDTKRAAAVLEGTGLTLEQAVAFAARHHVVGGAVCGIDQAMDEAAKFYESAWSAIHHEKTTQRWNTFAKYLKRENSGAASNISLVTELTISSFFATRKYTAKMAAKFNASLTPLFKFCKPRYIKVNPCKEVEMPTISAGELLALRIRSIHIFTPAAVQHCIGISLTTFTAKRYPSDSPLTYQSGSLTVWFVLGIFGGLRPDEARKYRWEWIDWEQSIAKGTKGVLHVPAHIAKDRRARDVPMESVLREWLLLFRREKGSVVPKNFRRHQQNFFDRCYPGENWQQDITRHSYASYHGLKYNDVNLTATNLGHRDLKVLFRHYLALIRRKTDGLKFWALGPKKFDLRFLCEF